MMFQQKKTRPWGGLAALFALLLQYACGSDAPRLYREAFAEGRVEPLEAFLEAFPDHPLADSARRRMMELDSIEIIIGTYLGGNARSFYGTDSPDSLPLVWKLYLGQGTSPAYGNPDRVWKGAGWTGQPLLVREKGELFLVLGCFDYKLKKIRAADGLVVWEYSFDDILKGTGTLWVDPQATKLKHRYLVLQGSRKGRFNDRESENVFSFRAISLINGKEAWRMNVRGTDSYSRDVDASALVVGEKAFIPLENGIFTVLHPSRGLATQYERHYEPEILQELAYYDQQDVQVYGDDIALESSSSQIGRFIFTATGTGKLHAYNLDTQRDEWVMSLGGDINGSMPVTRDSCLLVSIEKQNMPGQGGVMKIDPFAPEAERVRWFFPTPDVEWYNWLGGVVGSPSHNQRYPGPWPSVAVFADIAGNLYVVDPDQLAREQSLDPLARRSLPKPRLLASAKIEGTISTPIAVEDKIITATDNGLFLHQLVGDQRAGYSLKLLDKVDSLEIDATPIVHQGKVFVASRDGYLYCFGI